MSQHLKHHTHVRPVHPVDLKVVQQHDRSLSERVRGVGFSDTFQQFDLVEGGLCVVGGALDHLKRHKLFLR